MSVIETYLTWFRAEALRLADEGHPFGGGQSVCIPTTFPEFSTGGWSRWKLAFLSKLQQEIQKELFIAMYGVEPDERWCYVDADGVEQEGTTGCFYHNDPSDGSYDATSPTEIELTSCPIEHRQSYEQLNISRIVRTLQEYHQSNPYDPPAGPVEVLERWCYTILFGAPPQSTG